MLSLRQGPVLMLLLLVLAGCSTTTDHGRMSPSLDKALSDHIELGLRYLGDGQRQAARDHLKRALEIDPRSPGAHNGMALLFQLERELELAEKHYRKAIQYDKDFSRAHNNFGVFLFAQDRYKEAYEHFEAAASDTDYQLRPQVFVSLGIAALELDRREEALSAFRRATELEPSYPRPYLELAQIAFEKGDYKQARRRLRAFDRLSKPSARSLWLAVRIADHFDQEDTLASKGLALEKLFPDSPQNLEYQEWLKNDAGS